MPKRRALPTWRRQMIFEHADRHRSEAAETPAAVVAGRLAVLALMALMALVVEAAASLRAAAVEAREARDLAAAEAAGPNWAVEARGLRAVVEARRQVVVVAGPKAAGAGAAVPTAAGARGLRVDQSV